MTRTITVTLPGYQRAKLRPAFAVAFGERLQSEAITAAWYAAGCPSDFKATGLRSRVSRFLRGCRA